MPNIMLEPNSEQFVNIKVVGVGGGGGNAVNRMVSEGLSGLSLIHISWTAGIITLLVSFILTAILGKLLIPFLVKLKFGQTIKEIGPTWHEKKSGTPTMGGVMFIVGITVAIIVGMVMLSRQTSSSDISGIEQVTQIRVWGGLMMALGFGLIGFIDDFIKVVKKRNLGLTALQKTVMQFVLAIGYVATMTWSHACSTIVIFPFFGQVDFGWLYRCV